jgi:HD domain-containing protein
LPDQNKDLDWSKFISRLFQEAEPYLAARDDTLHINVSHQYSLILMKHEGGNEKIVEPAIILHDVGWSSLKPKQIEAAYGVRTEGVEADRLNRIHELEGASIARHILRSFNYESYLIDEIASIIQRHDSGNQVDSLEEEIVKDADKLWRFSKIGFLKEIERQDLNPGELRQYLFERYQGWFYTSSALTLAKGELEERAREIATRGEEHPPARHNGYKGWGNRACKGEDYQ